MIRISQFTFIITIRCHNLPLIRTNSELKLFWQRTILQKRVQTIIFETRLDYGSVIGVFWNTGKMQSQPGNPAMNKAETTIYIKSLAGELGFASCGISRAQELGPEASRFDRWLSDGKQGQMNYMRDHFDLYLDPRKLLPEAKSIVSLTYNYFPGSDEIPDDSFKISIYAHGRDYHKVLKKKLNLMSRRIHERIGEVPTRACVDSAPILEKAWAARSGLGWIGKNGNFLISRRGSYFFLAELLIDLELDYDSPEFDHCGKCRLCLDACPTGAIVEPYVVDARRCISYLTIEHKGELPREMSGTYQDWIYGCDICQQVCPFNRFAAPHGEEAFDPHPRLLSFTREQWRTLSPERYEALFTGSAVNRAGYEGLKRNIRFVDH